jgi:DNA-directed RNA polymerase subunit RPC12/RpoP
VPVSTQIDCPGCGERLVRKPGGRCPSCGAEVAAHVQETRTREERIEQVVAVVSTVLVLGLFLFTAGLGLVEGVAAYAVGGALVWFLAKRLFY